MMKPAIAEAFSLADRVAVVTGAASGLGQESACVLAQAGAHVVLADVNEAGLAQTAAMIAEFGGTATVRPTDVSQRAQVDLLADVTLCERERLDVWVNIAGILLFGPILETQEADFDRLFGVNLKGTYWGCAAAARAMTGRGGSIINFASAAADMPAPGLSLYSMSKAAVNMLTRDAAMEFGALGCRVNSVAPGFVDTPMVQYRYLTAEGEVDPEQREQILRSREQGSPLGILGEPRDIALAVLYLASDASRFVTGQVLRPNGGAAMP